MLESYIPSIIDGLVDGNLNPGDVCESIGMCEASESTHPQEHTTTWWDGGKETHCVFTQQEGHA